MPTASGAPHERHRSHSPPARNSGDPPGSPCPPVEGVFRDLYSDAVRRMSEFKQRSSAKAQEQLVEAERQRNLAAHRLREHQRQYECRPHSSGPIPEGFAAHLEREARMVQRKWERARKQYEWQRRRMDLDELAECTFTPSIFTRPEDRTEATLRSEFIHQEKSRIDEEESIEINASLRSPDASMQGTRNRSRGKKPLHRGKGTSTPSSPTALARLPTPNRAKFGARSDSATATEIHSPPGPGSVSGKSTPTPAAAIGPGSPMQSSSMQGGACHGGTSTPCCPGSPPAGRTAMRTQSPGPLAASPVPKPSPIISWRPPMLSEDVRKHMVNVAPAQYMGVEDADTPVAMIPPPTWAGYLHRDESCGSFTTSIASATTVQTASSVAASTGTSIAPSSASSALGFPLWTKGGLTVAMRAHSPSRGPRGSASYAPPSTTQTPQQPQQNRHKATASYAPATPPQCGTAPFPLAPAKFHDNISAVVRPGANSPQRPNRPCQPQWPLGDCTNNPSAPISPAACGARGGSYTPSVGIGPSVLPSPGVPLPFPIAPASQEHAGGLRPPGGLAMPQLAPQLGLALGTRSS